VLRSAADPARLGGGVDGPGDPVADPLPARGAHLARSAAVNAASLIEAITAGSAETASAARQVAEFSGSAAVASSEGTQPGG
jgi:hypothetical protein